MAYPGLEIDRHPSTLPLTLRQPNYGIRIPRLKMLERVLLPQPQDLEMLRDGGDVNTLTVEQLGKIFRGRIRALLVLSGVITCTNDDTVLKTLRSLIKDGLKVCVMPESAQDLEILTDIVPIAGNVIKPDDPAAYSTAMGIHTSNPSQYTTAVLTNTLTKFGFSSLDAGFTTIIVDHPGEPTRFEAFARKKLLPTR